MRSVIIADDYADGRAQLADCVRFQVPGTIVDQAGNGRQLVEMVRTKEYDLIFVDNNMPVMGGLEAIQEIRKFNKTIPIYMIAGSLDDTLPKRVVESGANGYIGKGNKGSVEKTKEAIDRHLHE
jgi:CheY-like chemotaxis protein